MLSFVCCRGVKVILHVEMSAPQWAELCESGGGLARFTLLKCLESSLLGSLESATVYICFFIYISYFNTAVSLFAES